MEQKVKPAGEDRLNYKMTFTLRHMSAVSVVVALWSNDRIRAPLIGCLRFRDNSSQLSLLRRNSDQTLSENAAKLHTTKRDLKFLLSLSRRVGNELFLWIRTMYKYAIMNVHPSDLKVKYVTLDHRYVVWTCVGQVNYKKTTMRLLRFGKLDVHLRFRLACDFCLEEDIIKLWHGYRRGTFLEKESDILVKFWKSQLLKRYDFFAKLVETSDYEQDFDRNVKEFVFYWALNEKNETGARYMWDNHRKEFKDRQPFPKAIKEAGSLYKVDFMFHLLTQADQEEQENSFKYACKQILDGVLNNRWWDSYLWDDHYLPTLRRLMKFMDPNDFDESLKLVAKFIVVSHGSDKTNFKAIFKELWQYCPKEHLFQLNEGVPMCNEILCSLFRRRSKDMVQLILSGASVQDRKKMLFSLKGITTCRKFLVRKEWDLFDLFIEGAFESEEDFKKFTLELNIPHYVNEDECDWTEKFLLNSSFKNTEEMVKLKLELALEDKNEVVTKLIEKSLKDGAFDFTLVDDFLLWCFLSDTDVRKFKLKMISNEVRKWNTTMYLMVCELLRKDHFELADMLLKWCTSYEANMLGNIVVFKNKCILEIFQNHTEMEEIIVGAFNIDRLKDLLKWFHPTNEILKECRELLSARKCPKLLLVLWDNFIQRNE